MWKCFAIISSIFILPLVSLSQEKFQWDQQTITLKKGSPFQLNVPRGYRINVAAQGLERPRFFCKSPDGRLFVTDMHNRGDNHKGRVLILENWDHQRKTFGKVTTFLENLHNPNQVAFYTAGGQVYLYIAETGKLSYYRYTPGDSIAAGAPVVIGTFPDYGLSYKYGGWHLTRSIAFNKGKIYVSVGSSCDACIEKEDVRATVMEMDPDGGNKRIFARGIRNAVGIKWVKDVLWVTHMGRDNRGPDKPEELFHPVVENGFYGWPYYYQYRKTIVADTQFVKSSRPGFVRKPVVAPYSFKAHAAPLGFEYVSDFEDPLLNRSFLVALHGSTSVWRQRGNAVVQLLPGGGYREIIKGFLQGKTEDKRYGRPCDIIQWDTNSFFISDDKRGVIYFFTKG
ncbi:PQQ-dependent sugar dehydrogenase [Niabella drilacis]|uniref:Glucose/arabinose dehydrogenase, beta-propeller fold n=1 Tax=Niabella drilacis (strain DSM 25811 / CCM 8410 / CCUG 62505 / LMG 26954 / E90) TaxID=1285928 RepID=A0A1G6XE34_NIADE|nr:PQQ-dependent sugar dehydrogenase [Niabella drilacis]SDD76312.1 Glucose/arabinose dehydrogenase, beta-propeller fold [Niabella drilacis]